MADDIDTRLADWEARLDRLEENEETRCAVRAPTAATSSSYRRPLATNSSSEPDPCLAPGDVLELDEGKGRYVVSRVIRSPLPDDTRPCVYFALI